MVILLLVHAEVYNEYRAKKAIASLQTITAPTARVMRDGRISDIAVETLVPGDLLILTPGSIAAADGYIQQSMSLQVNESALTGESLPQSKREGGNIYAGTTVMGNLIPLQTRVRIVILFIAFI